MHAIMRIRWSNHEKSTQLDIDLENLASQLALLVDLQLLLENIHVLSWTILASVLGHSGSRNQHLCVPDFTLNPCLTQLSYNYINYIVLLS